MEKKYVTKQPWVLSPTGTYGICLWGVRSNPGAYNQHTISCAMAYVTRTYICQEATPTPPPKRLRNLIIFNFEGLGWR